MTAPRLFLGRAAKPGSSELGARVEIDPRDLLTHAVIVGMTGSGKTGLAIGLIEEVLRSGVPVLAIDPKGDLGNLLLAFDDLSPASFEPWVDAESARREGVSVREASERAAATWAKGLAEWGLGAQDIRALNAGREALIFTPGSSAGRGLSILGALSRPGKGGDLEETREEIGALVAGLLGLVGVDADPLQSREYILLSSIVEAAWKEGKELTLEGLVAGVASPPLERLGALPLETVFPRNERTALMLRLNNLVASPQFQAWRAGDPLDVAALLRGPDGRPRLSIISTAHLADSERMFVTALTLDAVRSWVRRQPGTTELRAVLYMDEVFGYLPPHPADPASKKPLLTLLKQARAQGLGVVLATQNPVDLDYKALSNMGAWFVGKLQTENDANRVLEGLTSAGLEASRARDLLAGTRKRVFLLHDVHRDGPELVHTRWAMSYLRGPLTRDDVQRLMRGQAGAAPTAAAGGPSMPPAFSTPPLLPDPYRSFFFARYGGSSAEAHLFIKYAVKPQGGDEIVDARLYPLVAPSASEILDGEFIDLDEAEDQLAPEAPPGLRYADLPAYVVTAGARGLERAVRERLAGEFTFTVLVDPASKARSHPDEPRDEFAARLAARAAAGSAKGGQLAQRIARKKLDLARAEQELKGREQEKKLSVLRTVVDVGGSLLGGFLGGRRSGAVAAIRRGASAMGGVASKNRMEENAEARVTALREEIIALEDELRGLEDVDPSTFEEITVAASKAGTRLLRTEIVWVY